MRSPRVWWLALTGSLLIHAALVAGLTGLSLQSDEPPVAPPPIEARLMPPPAPALRPAAPPPRRPRPAPRIVPPAPVQPPASAAASVSPPDAEVPVAPPPPQEPLTAAEAGPADLPGPDAAPPSPLNPLPPRIDMRFQVRYGLARGEQTLVWIGEGNRYTVTSVAAATGLAGVFYSGRFVQTSSGRITPQGLVPEEFWDQRGDKRSSARFDADAGRVTLTPAQGAPRHFAYAGAVQDALSLFFQLALTAPPEGQFAYTVFNGKKLRDYAYEARGDVALETGLGALRTLHLVRANDRDGRFEVWLAIDRHYLPVRVLRVDDKGNEVQLDALSIAP